MTRILMMVLLLLTGCSGDEGFSSLIDRMSFRLTGGTVFSSPAQITTKELHFDTGRLLGQDVIVKGTVVVRGKYSTHFVVEDGSGRILIKLTEMPDSREQPEAGSVAVKVLGTVERGKKGLPYIMASSVNWPEPDTILKKKF